MPPLRTKDAMPELNARQYMLYEKLECIAEELGPFDWSSGPNGAHYMNAFVNPFAGQGLQCANCVFFRGGGSCEIVAGPIEPGALCKLWVIPESLIVQSMVYEIAQADGSVSKRQVAGIQHKEIDLSILETRKDGGKILISTPSFDRDADRVLPMGGRVDDYLKNPIVQWGHNYYDPWATIGRTTSLEITPDGLVADFELRPAANDLDPQNIVLLLWNGGWVKTASIGFKPEAAAPNERGGLDFTGWSLLEWSVVPIPANQDALRLAHESYPKAMSAYTKALKAGRVLSTANEQKLRDARDAIDSVLSQMPAEDVSGLTNPGMNDDRQRSANPVADDIDLSPLAAALARLQAKFL